MLYFFKLIFEGSMVRPLVSSKVNEIHHFFRQDKSCSEISLLLSVSKSSVGRNEGRCQIYHFHHEEAEKNFVRDHKTPHFKRSSAVKVENAIQIQKQLAEN